MARQYDVEDLLNSDATDPDGEPTPVATNDDVRDGKIIVETADGTGKIGDVSQIVADYLKKSAGFFTEIRPYYIVRPATGQAWTGTWELFLHGIDDGGLSDAVNITIGINGVVVHTQAWTASSGARDIEFSINTTESAALIASPPTGSYARCYVAFHGTDGNEIVIRHFSLKLVDTVPKIPEDEIPDSIARDDEVTAAIASALAAHPGVFDDSLALGNFARKAGATAGHYVIKGTTQVDISYTNVDNENKESIIRNIQVGHGLVFNDDRIFVIEWTNQNATYREFNGFWVNGEADTTALDAEVSISVIQHELRMIRFMTADQVASLAGAKILSKLKPSVRIYPNAKRKDLLTGFYEIRVSNLDAIFPDVDEIKVYFDNILVLESNIDKTFTNSSFVMGSTNAETIKDRTPETAGFWVLKTELLKDDVVHYTIETPVYYLLELSAFHYFSLNRERIEVVENKTADMFVHTTPGDFVDTNNQNIVSIAAVERTAANLAAIANETFNFTDFTYVPLNVVIPSDATNNYDIILRVRKSLADPQSHLRVYERTVGVDTSFPLRQLLAEDEQWKYYSTVEAGAGEDWIVQYRGTHPHNTYGGNLGETPLRDVDSRVEAGIIGKKTTDLVLTEQAGVYTDVEDENVAGMTLLERTSANEQAITNNSVDWSTHTWQNPTLEHTDDSKQYYLVVRIPKALGDIGSQFRISSTPSGNFAFTAAEVNDATYNYFLVGIITGTITVTVQRQGQEDKTRYDGELGGKALEQAATGATGSELDNIQDKISDLHVQDEVGAFADTNDATKQGITIIENTAANKAKIVGGAFDYTTPTWQVATVSIPNDSNEYWVIVRVAKSEGNVETQYQVVNNGNEAEHLRRHRQEDATWYYYIVVAELTSTWTLQRRATHTHTRYDGELGSAALEQVTGHQSVEDLEDKTSDIHINDPPGDFANLTTSTIGGIAALLESPAVLSAIAAGTYDFTALTWNNPSVSYSPTRGQEYQVIVRVAKTTIETQFRVLLKHAIGDIQRYYGIGESIHSDTNWNYYTAVRGGLAATATLEYRETHTHTRYDGELGAAALAQVDARSTGAGITADQVARLLPALPAEGERNAKIAKFVGNVLTWLVDPAGEDITALADRLSTDETKLNNFIQTVNNYFKGQGEGDVTADQIAYLFALLDEYNPVIDDIRSTLGLVSELGEPTRLIEAYEDQTTFLSNAAVPSTLPKIEYLTAYLDSGRQDALLYAVGESTLNNETIGFNYTTLNNVVTGGSGGSNDPFLRYYLNGDTDEADGIQRCAFFISDNRVFILLQKHTGGGTDPLAAFTSASLRPYISYAPLDDLAIDGTITKQAVETLAPTNADHDIPFVPSFQALLPDRRIALQEEDARGWYVSNFDADTAITFNKILAKWYADFQWLSRMYEDFRRLVEVVERGVGNFDPRRQNWVDGSKNPLDPANSVVRPPYASLDALKAAFPIPDLTFYFKLSVDGMVMNLADHDIHRPKRNKLVQIPDTHYNTPPRVTFLPMIARENEVFQLVSDQYRPNSDHTWTFQPERRTVNNRTVAGASIPTTLGGIHQKIGETSDSNDRLPDIFQRNAVNAIVAFADDPEHLHLYINPLRATTTDVLTVEIHGFRSDRSPIVRTATFRYAETFSISADSIRRFQSRVSGAYGILDLSDTISISIKRGNTYLYLNEANSPATPEWETGLLHTAGLYKGLADGSFVKAEFPTLDTWNHVVARSNTFFSGTGPDAARGVDNQFWVNLRTGQIYQKSSGTWGLITDVALQTEISRAIEWSTIPNNTSIPANFITKHSNRYFGAKLQHVKTSGSTAPTGDATNWIELSNEASAGSSAVAVEWSSIAQNSGVALGTIVKHGNYTYMCITAHNRRGNGPDSDSTNWQLLTNYQGTWATGYYHSGAIVNIGRNVYIALQNVLNTDPSPTATTNTKWLQINNTEPPARYAELTINSAVALSRTYASLTFASALAKSQNATGVIARATSGSAISIAAGSYVVDTHIVVAGGSDNARSNYDVQLYDGTNIIDEKTHVGYVRRSNELGDEAFSSHHILTVTQTTALQVRVKLSPTGTGGIRSINTSAGGTIIIRKI